MEVMALTFYWKNGAEIENTVVPENCAKTRF